MKKRQSGIRWTIRFPEGGYSDRTFRTRKWAKDWWGPLSAGQTIVKVRIVEEPYPAERS